MHSAGWVHRDVSVGNLLVDGPKNCRLIDMEYAKKMGTEEEFRIVRDMVTSADIYLIQAQGTSPFIALEVENQDYRFSTWSQLKPLKAPTYNHREYRLAGKRAPVVPHGPSDAEAFARLPPLKFRYNPLHDMESLWWVAVYLVLKRDVVPGTTGEEPEAAWDSKAQQSYVCELFGAKRDRLFSHPATLIYDLHRVVHPALWPAASILNDLRLSLLTAYHAAEKNLDTLDEKCADGLYDLWIEKLTLISRDPGMQSLMLREFPSDKSKKVDPIPHAAKVNSDEPHSRSNAILDRSRPSPDDDDHNEPVLNAQQRSTPAGHDGLVTKEAFDGAKEMPPSTRQHQRAVAEDERDHDGPHPSDSTTKQTKRTRQTKRRRSAAVDTPPHRYNLRPRKARGM